MSHISVATAIEKNKIASGTAFLLLLDIEVYDNDGEILETVYLTKNSENFEYQENLYQASDFSIDITESLDGEPSLKIDAKDPSGFIRERMDAYDGGVGSTARVVLLNTGAIDMPPEIREEFKIVSAAQQGYNVSFTLGVDNPLYRRFPPHLQSRNQCGLDFKSTLCKYAGPDTTCSYSKTGDNGCNEKGNTVNFRAFPGLQR